MPLGRTSALTTCKTVRDPATGEKRPIGLDEDYKGRSRAPRPRHLRATGGELRSSERHRPEELKEAEPLCREALRGRRARPGDDHPNTLRCIRNLANLLTQLGQWEEAEQLYREHLEGYRATQHGAYGVRGIRTWSPLQPNSRNCPT